MRVRTNFGFGSRQPLYLLAVSAALTWSVGCTKDFEGEYADPDKVEIVDDKWNETDARKTGDDLVKQALSKPWLELFKKEHNGKRPVVLVGNFENRTDEHIDTQALVEAMQNALINSGSVDFVADKGKRQQILDEIAYQQSGAVAKTSKKAAGKQTGADFMFHGALSSSVHGQGELKTVTYQTNATLIDIEDGVIKFSGIYPIKKRFKRSGAGL